MKYYSAVILRTQQGRYALMTNDKSNLPHDRIDCESPRECSERVTMRLTNLEGRINTYLGSKFTDDSEELWYFFLHEQLPMEPIVDCKLVPIGEFIAALSAFEVGFVYDHHLKEFAS